MTKVSIIVPVYNVELYIDKCLESLINQSMKDIEIILIDDGSTDNSGKICDSYAIKDKKVKVIHKNNRGLSNSRNCGLDIAKGEYISFVDSDDFIHPQMIEILYKTIISNNGDIVICDFQRIYENNNIKFKQYKTEQNIKIYNNIEALNELYSKNVVKFVIAWNKLYKRELFINLRYREKKFHEDEFIIHELLYRSNKVIDIPLQLYFYLQRQDSIMGAKFSVKRLDGLDAYRERIHFFQEKHEKELLKKAVFRYSKEFFQYYYKLKYEVSNNKKYLRKIKKDYNHIYKYIIISPYYTKKEKMLITLFCINSKLYEMYINLKRGGYKNCKGKIGQP